MECKAHCSDGVTSCGAIDPIKQQQLLLKWLPLPKSTPRVRLPSFSTLFAALSGCVSLQEEALSRKQNFWSLFYWIAWPDTCDYV